MKTLLASDTAGNFRLKLKLILVPVDFSEAARESISYGVALARQMRAKIVLLHVIEPVFVGPEPGLAYVPKQTEIQEKEAEDEMLGLATELIPKGLFDKTVLRTGCPYYEITMAAKSLDVDLIVITTHGRTGLSHVLMGSTAERVVRHAQCPVLTIRRTPGHAARCDANVAHVEKAEQMV